MAVCAEQFADYPVPGFATCLIFLTGAKQAPFAYPKASSVD
jgi:hypothetical protein